MTVTPLLLSFYNMEVKKHPCYIYTISVTANLASPVSNEFEWEQNIQIVKSLWRLLCYKIDFLIILFHLTN